MRHGRMLQDNALEGNLPVGWQNLDRLRALSIANNRRVLALLRRDWMTVLDNIESLCAPPYNTTPGLRCGRACR